MSIHRRGKQLGRDCKSAHSEISLLIQTGLMVRTVKDEVRLGWDRIVTELDLAAWLVRCHRNFVSQNFNKRLIIYLVQVLQCQQSLLQLSLASDLICFERSRPEHRPRLGSSLSLDHPLI